MGQEMQIGETVVFMDSNLRGRVVSTNPVIKVELEDGFVIEAHREELLVVNPTQMKMLQESSQRGGSKNIKGSHGCSPRKSPLAKHIKVDLHIEAIPSAHKVPQGGQLNFQLDYFRQVLRANLRHRGMKISFVHGVGDGILKDLIRKELDEVYPHKCTYLPSSPGVTVVTIR